MSREQELALCAREFAKAEREVMLTADPGAFVGMNDWLHELDLLLAEGEPDAR